MRSLLTRDERQNLRGPARRELHQQRHRERRAERKAERRARRLKWIELDTLAKLAEPEIRDMAAVDIPGRAKMDAVLDMLIDRADDFLIWKFIAKAGPIGVFIAAGLEELDGPVLRLATGWLIRPHVQDVFDSLRMAA